MTPLPALTNWDTTKDALHRAAQVVAAFRKAFSPKLPNALHLSLYIRNGELTTGPLPFGAMALHLGDGRVCVTLGGHRHDISLGGANPALLRGAVIAMLKDNGIEAEVPPIKDEAPFEIDTGLGRDYADALWRITGALRQLRADWIGTVTPLVVWPHGFDASQLYFPGGSYDEHAEPHLNYGFSPGSAGLPRPYVYAYAYPMPAGVYGTPLPDGARWHDQGWTGVAIDYDRMVLRGFSEDGLAETLRQVHTMLATRLVQQE